jgi:hypothetical protein
MRWSPKIQVSGTGLALVSGLAPTLGIEAPYFVRFIGTVIGLAMIAWPGAVFLLGILRQQSEMWLIIGMFVGGGLFLSCAIAFWSSPKLDHITPSDVVFLPPVYEFKLEWRAPQNNEIIMSPDRRQNDVLPLTTGLPIFRIKNIASTVARQVTIQWHIENDLGKSINESKRLKKYMVRLTDHNLGIFSGNMSTDNVNKAMSINIRGKIVETGGGNGYVGGYASVASTDIPYLAPEINNDKYQDAVMPFDIAQLMEFLFVASLPNNLGPPAMVIPIFVEIKWTGQDTEHHAYYRIDASAFNISDTAPAGSLMPPPPEILSLLRFTTTPIDSSHFVPK